jgi:cytoskeleton protein RodZ
LHLRVRLIELLEADDYKQMPEPVFIMGYLRAYAKLLGVAPEPFILLFSTQYSLEKKPEKALWQSRRESNRGELVVRWFTALVAVTAILAVSFWWQKNKEEQPFFSAKNKSVITPVKTNNISAKDNVNVEPEIKMTELSKMESMFSSNAEDVPAEKQGD